MTNVFTWMMRIPLVLVTSSMDAFSRAMQELQRSFDRGPGGMTAPSGFRSGPGSRNPRESSHPAGLPLTGGAEAVFNSTSNRLNPMESLMQNSWLGSCNTTDPTGCDLSGDDLKVVRYRILFTKPDLEHSFVEKTEVVAYSTNAGSLGGIKVAHFLGDVSKGKYERPEKWVGNDYPAGLDFPGGSTVPRDEKNWRFPEEDERYIEFQCEVIRREPKQDPNYDRDRNKGLRGIRQSIEDLARRLPPAADGGGGGHRPGAGGGGHAGPERAPQST